MRIVIVGGGQVGSSLARTLSADHEVVVIDQDPQVEDAVQSCSTIASRLIAPPVMVWSIDGTAAPRAEMATSMPTRSN